MLLHELKDWGAQLEPPPVDPGDFKLGQIVLEEPPGEIVASLPLSWKPPTNEEESRKANIAARLAEHIAIEVEEGLVGSMFFDALLLGATLREIAGWPLIATALRAAGAEVKRIANLKKAAEEERARKATEAMALLEAEREKAPGKHFIRSVAIVVVAEKMKVDPRTVRRYLKEPKGQP